jgi:hypothetical protein
MKNCNTCICDNKKASERVVEHELAHKPLSMIDRMYDLNPPQAEKEPFRIGETACLVLAGISDTSIVITDEDGREMTFAEIVALKFAYLLVVPDKDLSFSGQLLAPGVKLKYSTRSSK